VDRPDRNLVQAFALDREEGIGFARARRGPRAERDADVPTMVVEPGPRVGRVLGGEAEQVVDRALEADGGRMETPHRRKTSVGAFQADHADRAPAFVEERHVDPVALPPKAEEDRRAVPEGACEVEPGVGGNHGARPRAMRLDPSAFSDRVGERGHD
jgi:hypothetical protein